MDLGSRNGTYVNDQRVVMPVTLQTGARIRIANNDLIFEQEVRVREQRRGGGHHWPGSSDPAMQTVHNAAILVCDIRGFSTQSEILPASTLAQLLGQWFREAGNAVQKHGGVIDKFIGDADPRLLAGKPRPAARVRATRVPMRAPACSTSPRKMKWPESGKPFTVGIAMHYGRVAFGNIGLVAQRDATIIGNAVNTAFRLESVMKELNQKLARQRADGRGAGTGGTRGVHGPGRKNAQGQERDGAGRFRDEQRSAGGASVSGCDGRRVVPRRAQAAAEDDDQCRTDKSRASARSRRRTRRTPR